MISAFDALLLPTATLSQKDREAADLLEEAIDKHIQAHMEWAGCEFTTDVTRKNVIAEVDRRLRSCGYNPQWQMRMVTSALGGVGPRHVGYLVAISPSYESRQEAIAFGAHRAQ